MDSNMRDESRDRRREEALARRLGEAFDRTASRGGEPCPDAEAIAAYHGQELGPEEYARCETHFAACSRCRKILAVLAASDETPLAEKEVARLGELVATARPPREAAAQTAKPARPNRLDWRMRWLAPALGVAAVMAVWFAIRPPWRTVDQGASGTLIAQAPKNEPLPPAESLPVDQFPNAAAAKKANTQSATPSPNSREESASKTEPAKPKAEALAKRNLDEGRAVDRFAASGQGAGSVPEDEKQEASNLNSTAAATPPPPPPPPAIALRAPLVQAQSNAAGQAAPSVPEAPGSTAQSVSVTGEAPVVETTNGAAANAPARDKQALAGQRRVADLPLNGRNVQTLATLGGAGKTVIQIGAPSAKVFWRAGKGGSIEQSTGAGKTWRAQTSPFRDDWLAGAAVSDTVCWIVGRNGAIARTTDGEHWEKIAPPPMSADASGKLPDWINITASSAQSVTITATDQRRYTTQDGGKTWQSR